MTLTIVPEKGKDYAFTIMDGDKPLFRAVMGATGSCWNIGDPYDPEETVHVCDLDEAIAALTALRDSSFHADHVKRWEGP